ncbi:MAG: hypothetical protein D6814_10560 [Calditrichaeota bacterium]|nr:MAG: hypothetical protein D6814_10560 [Calditrichota bacterium]
MNANRLNIVGKRWIIGLSILVATTFFELGFVHAPQMLNAQDIKNDNAGRVIKKEGITAYIVRDKEKNTIKLTMLIAHNNALTRRIQNMVGRKVLPLIFSVSTVPGQAYYFNPSYLQFEQNGKTWRPDSSALDSLIIILEENGKFGGLVEGGQTHQAVVLLPSWFKINAPILVRYIEKPVSGFQVTQAAKRP